MKENVDYLLHGRDVALIDSIQKALVDVAVKGNGGGILLHDGNA